VARDLGECRGQRSVGNDDDAGHISGFGRRIIGRRQ
jgi:hypothetical protein